MAVTRLTRGQSRERTKGELRKAALNEFAGAGYAGASIDRICEAAGFSRGSFYANYASKHELMLELMREMSELEVKRWRELIAAHSADREDFAASVAQRFEALMEETPWALFAVEAQLQARRDSQFASKHREYMSFVDVSIKALLSMSFQHAGKQLPDDLELLSRTFYSLSLGMFLSSDLACPKASAKVAGAAMARLYRGLLATAPDAK
ncbi:TetR/AcrR family transcriptional regulator [Pseudomonas sp. NPDC086251]|uniref:TetR/AcrR family transcriptional regulator n=1 Tax=Pseudomonas sp. NPDC086251 TaxID=3364431 RepID=UPI003837B1CB